MKEKFIRFFTGRQFANRWGLVALLLILLLVACRSTLLALAKPFWYDELITVHICHLPTMADIWKALNHAADTMPPAFYFIERIARELIPDDHLGYRVPSMLGVMVAISCVYLFLSRRVSQLTALAGATFVLCTPLATFYGAEARPYGLLVGCFSVAMLAWQRIDDSELYAFGLAAALAAAASLHYYAILVWPAFLAAELSVWTLFRRFRAVAWASIVVGLLPLAFVAPILAQVRQYYGQHFWAQPSIKLAFTTHGWLFNLGGHWGWILALGVTAVLLAMRIRRSAPFGSGGQGEVRVAGVPFQELVLALMLLWLPLIAVAAAEAGHGGMSERYMLPTILGGALAVAYVIDKAPSAAKVLLLLLFLMNYASSSVGLVASAFHGALLEDRMSAVSQVDTIAKRANEPNLPIVISDELEYLPIPYYAPASSRRVYAVTDPKRAVAFSGAKTDSGSLNLRILRQYFPLQVANYVEFITTHNEFLLVSDSDPDEEWLPTSLLHDGYTLKLVSPASLEQSDTIYKVTRNP